MKTGKEDEEEGKATLLPPLRCSAFSLDYDSYDMLRKPP